MRHIKISVVDVGPTANMRVEVKRLHELTPSECLRSGFINPETRCNESQAPYEFHEQIMIRSWLKEDFGKAWDGCYGRMGPDSWALEYTWAQNPLVVVLEFEDEEPDPYEWLKACLWEENPIKEASNAS